MTADPINNPAHYTHGTIEPISVIEDWNLGFHDGNALKYIARWKYKGGVEDLKKARGYLDRRIEPLSRSRMTHDRSNETDVVAELVGQPIEPATPCQNRLRCGSFCKGECRKGNTTVDCPNCQKTHSWPACDRDTYSKAEVDALLTRLNDSPHRFLLEIVHDERRR